ncbi:MAG: hypothetical protein II650_05445 [Clostridia bacterium]|nr:hypothetical protein [Clostridia bacterium]
MRFEEMTFRRRFAVNFYKNKRLTLSEMRFSRDFPHTDRGDPYPLLFSDEDFTESAGGGLYTVESADGSVGRLLGQLFPYATYEMQVESLAGSAGFAFLLPDERRVSLLLTACGGMLSAVLEAGERRETHPTDAAFLPGTSLLVTLRPGALDLYLRDRRGIRIVHTFDVPETADTARREVFAASVAAVEVRGSASLSSVVSYLDSGISQADIRPIRYENGDVMIEGGKIWLTVSVRMQAGCYEGVFSWVPGTEEFELTGALFFDDGDGLWGNDVAASVLYHRGEGRWMLWVCSFCRGHILGHADFPGDPRFGVNAIDIKLMDKMTPGAEEGAFLGKAGDEDPDFRYDAARGVWMLAVCRVTASGYAYFFYESASPFDGYRLVGRTTEGNLTGGSFVTLDGETYFVCGTDDKVRRADYRVWKYGDFENSASLRCDYGDGGWRGWGTVIPVVMGSRRRFFWLTFDRDLGSGYNWSYGNLYGYEADEWKRA